MQGMRGRAREGLNLTIGTEEEVEDVEVLEEEVLEEGVSVQEAAPFALGSGPVMVKLTAVHYGLDDDVFKVPSVPPKLMDNKSTDETEQVDESEQADETEMFDTEEDTNDDTKSARKVGRPRTRDNLSKADRKRIRKEKYKKKMELIKEQKENRLNKKERKDSKKVMKKRNRDDEDEDWTPPKLPRTTTALLIPEPELVEDENCSEETIKLPSTTTVKLIPEPESMEDTKESMQVTSTTTALLIPEHESVEDEKEFDYPEDEKDSLQVTSTTTALLIPDPEILESVAQVAKESPGAGPVRQLKCDQCEESFTSVQNLNVHKFKNAC